MEKDPLTVGDLRKLIEHLPDDAAILYEAEYMDEGHPLTFKLKEAKVFQVELGELHFQDCDISYFSNSIPDSVPALIICAHEGNLSNYVVQPSESEVNGWFRHFVPSNRFLPKLD